MFRHMWELRALADESVTIVTVETVDAIQSTVTTLEQEKDEDATHRQSSTNSLIRQFSIMQPQGWFLTSLGDEAGKDTPACCTLIVSTAFGVHIGA